MSNGTPWYKRTKPNIVTPSEERREVPEGIWIKCPKCGAPTHIKALKEAFYVCPKCDYHHRIGSQEYFEILFGSNGFEELDATMESADPLHFVDRKPYPQRIKEAQEKTGLKDAVRTAVGQIGPYKVALGCMDFHFIGGSMGSVVGEKLARLIRRARKERLPLIIITKSGGARMMEGLFSLMQMAKTAAELALFEKEQLPYIVVLTDPTTGGVTASFAMLGDIHIAEPGALIGFAGPRVIKETIKKDLPEGFQSSEFLLEHGFIDLIVHRHQLKQTLIDILSILLPDEAV